jgi:hypothetical protein
MWIKIQELGLSEAYLKNKEVRRYLKLPQVLAFVPVEDVAEKVYVLKTEVSDKIENNDIFATVLKFFDYFF